MARRVITQIVTTDDLNGEEIPEGHGANFRFAWDGSAYEIDLGDDNAAQVRALMGRLTDAGRKIGRFHPEMPNSKKSKAVASKESAPALPGPELEEGLSPWKQEAMVRQQFREIREWARANGWPDHPNYAKLRGGVREAWNAAHPDRPAPPEGAGTSYKRHKRQQRERAAAQS